MQLCVCHFEMAKRTPVRLIKNVLRLFWEKMFKITISVGKKFDLNFAKTKKIPDQINFTLSASFPFEVSCLLGDFFFVSSKQKQERQRTKKQMKITRLVNIVV